MKRNNAKETCLVAFAKRCASQHLARNRSTRNVPHLAQPILFKNSPVFHLFHMGPGCTAYSNDFLINSMNDLRCCRLLNNGKEKRNLGQLQAACSDKRSGQQIDLVPLLILKRSFYSWDTPSEKTKIPGRLDGDVPRTETVISR